jgi:hypothetical protein
MLITVDHVFVDVHFPVDTFLVMADYKPICCRVFNFVYVNFLSSVIFSRLLSD